jgi:hypothetical protein
MSNPELVRLELQLRSMSCFGNEVTFPKDWGDEKKSDYMSISSTNTTKYPLLCSHCGEGYVEYPLCSCAEKYAKVKEILSIPGTAPTPSSGSKPPSPVAKVLATTAVPSSKGRQLEAGKGHKEPSPKPKGKWVKVVPGGDQNKDSKPRPPKINIDGGNLREPPGPIVTLSSVDFPEPGPKVAKNLSHTTLVDGVLETTKYEMKAIDGVVSQVIEQKDERSVKESRKVRVENVNFSLNPVLESYFAEHYPSTRFNPNATATPHPHARLAYERKHAESFLVGLVAKQFTIVDIGGNAQRHFRAGRANVWSCCPVIDTVDSVRNARYGGAPNWCNCLFEHCIHQPNPDVYLCVHSIYYLDPDLVCEAVHGCKRRSLYSVHHEFRKAFSSLAQGEANYMVSATGRLRMKVTGNLVDYEHDACDWLFKGYYKHSSLPMAISWSIIRTFATSVATLFVPAELSGIPPPVGFVGMQPALTEDNYYGKVLHGGAFHDAASNTSTTDMVRQVYAQLDIYSWGSYVLTVDTKTSNYAILPKPLISEMASWIAGKPRDPTTFSTLIARCREKIKRYDIPPELVPQAIVVSAVLGFVANLENEMSLMAHVVNKHNVSFTTMNSLLKFEVPAHVSTNKLLAMLSVCLLMSPILGWGVLPALALLGLFSFFWMNKKHKILDPEKSFYLNFEQHKVTQESFTMPAMGMIPLRGVLRKAPIDSERPVKPLSTPYESGEHMPKLQFTNELDRKEQKETLSGIGLVVPEAIPVVHASSAQNELLAIQNRALAVKFAPRVETGKMYLSWLSLNMDTLFPGRKPTKYNFPAWNSRYPPAQRAIHSKLHAEAGGVLEDPHSDRRIKAFAKMEKLMLSGVNQFEDKDPRAIQGSTDAYSVFCGPYIWSFGKRLAEVWNSKFQLFYASGVLPEEIGAWFEYIGHNNPEWNVWFSDFSRWDSSQNEYLLKGGDMVNLAFGVPEDVVLQQRLDQKKGGNTVHGVKYQIDNTVASGRHTTSCNNSSQHGCVILFNLQVNNPGVELRELLELQRSMVLGDDDVVGLRKGVAPPSVAVYEALGLDVKLQRAENTYMADFCSSYFWPTKDGIVLGPKPGRLLPKMGWYLNQHDKNVAGVHKATLQSLYNVCSFVPPLKSIVDTQLRVLSSVRPKVAERTSQVDIRSAKQHDPCHETWEMLDVLYSWGPSDQETLDVALKAVKSLPTVIGGTLLYKLLQGDSQFPGASALGYFFKSVQTAENPSGALLSTIIFSCFVSPFLEEVFKRAHWPLMILSVRDRVYFENNLAFRLCVNSFSWWKHLLIWAEFGGYVEGHYMEHHNDPPMEYALEMVYILVIRSVLVFLHYHWANQEFWDGFHQHGLWNFLVLTLHFICGWASQ